MGNTDSLGVYRSADGGLTWQEANDANIGNHCINDLAVHPTAPNLVYAATAAGGVFKTTDGGQHWTHLSGLTPVDIRAIAVRPDQPGMVYVGTAGKGVYVYNEGSGTWQQMTAGMEPNDSIFALVFDPTNPNVIWAGSNKTGVYRWDPVQSLWVHVNDGLRTRAVTDLAISADGLVLYASTWGEGVFRLGDVSLGQMVYLPLLRK
jgi:WD40 repeat protein